MPGIEDLPVASADGMTQSGLGDVHLNGVR